MGRKGESIYPQLNSEEFLVQKYLEDGIPAASIAKEVGGKCDTGAVTLALKKFGIPVRGPMGYPPKESKFPLLNDKSFLQNAYVDQRLSDKEIAIMVGASESNVIRYLKRFNIPRREGADSLRNERKFPQLHDPDWLRMMYWDNGLNLSEIAEILGVAGNGVVSLIMKELGIPTRDRSECRVEKRL
jgi:transposase